MESMETGWKKQERAASRDESQEVDGIMVSPEHEQVDGFCSKSIFTRRVKE
jgi:hypothetical protein